MRPRSQQESVTRLRRLGSRAYLDHALRVQAIELHPRTRRIWVDGVERRRLGPMESALLTYLMEHAGEIVSRDDLITKVWRYPAGLETKTVDATLKNLRRKLGDDWRQPRFITTVWRRGVRFEREDARPATSCA